jgi:DNA-binding transcriptional regulator YiaG
MMVASRDERATVLAMSAVLVRQWENYEIAPASKSIV